MDVNELTRDALAASARNDSEAAIALLRQATEQDDAAAIPHYLLGAEYAQIGIIDRAVAEMARALENDPSLAPARFQLGLLHLTSGRVAEAAEAWRPLERLGTEDPLYLFKEGLLAMAQDRFEDARALLEAGLDRNVANAPLNADMRKVIAAIDRLVAGDGDADSGQHVLVSAYRPG